MIRFFHRFDWILFVSVVLLLGLGLAALYPISQAGAQKPGDESHFWKQVFFCAVGLAAFFAFSVFDYRNLKNYSTALFLGGLVLLLMVLVFGKVIRGTTGWIGIGGFHLQPVEPFKVIAAIALAKYFSLHARSLNDWKHIFISFVPVVFSILLILKQPDLGSALVIVFLWVAVLLMSGVNKKHLLILLAVAVIISLAAWLFFLKDYQKERITTLFNPNADPLGAGYNVIQSTVAVGSGGFWGKGLGHGSQSQLNFLPEKHTDFIFAVISEELGFGGAIFVFLLAGTVIVRSIRIAKNSRDGFGKILAGGIASVFFVQSLINIGMNIGVMPVTGITLPFLSYGGSSLITMLAGMGILESIHKTSRR
jgi:rod shape determining protein RodA